jgi:hypothetical protein
MRYWCDSEAELSSKERLLSGSLQKSRRNARTASPLDFARWRNCNIHGYIDNDPEPVFTAMKVELRGLGEPILYFGLYQP